LFYFVYTWRLKGNWYEDKKISDSSSREPQEKRPSKNYSLYILRSEKNKLKKYQEKRKAASTELEYQKRCIIVEKAETRIEKLKEKFAQVNPNF
jgi:hypothetical protein